MAEYNSTSKKAEEFINDAKIKQTLAFAEALKDDLDAPGAITHWKQEAYNSAMIFEEADFEPASMLYKHLNRTVFKRKLLLCFIWHVAHSASNFKNYYMDVEYVYQNL